MLSAIHLLIFEQLFWAQILALFHSFAVLLVVNALIISLYLIIIQIIVKILLKYVKISKQ